MKVSKIVSYIIGAGPSANPTCRHLQRQNLRVLKVLYRRQDLLMARKKAVEGQIAAFGRWVQTS